MKHSIPTPLSKLLSIGVSTFLLTTAASTVQAKDAIKIAVPAFLSGPAAGPFGVPARNGAEMVIDAINAGTLPEPVSYTHLTLPTICSV